MSNLWFGYFWPSLKGNGPEAILELMLVGGLGALIWPPVRKRIERFAKRHAEELHAKLDHNSQLMQHIIKHHPDIPEFKEKK